MKTMKENVTDLIDQELTAANKKFPMFNSNHEAYAVFLEEVEETLEEANTLEDITKDIWYGTKNNATPGVMHQQYTWVYETATNLILEGIQVAAMARKAILSNIGMAIVDIEQQKTNQNVSE